MLAKRIIPCLDVTAGRVVKGINFVELRDAGDPVEIAARYNEQGADELTFLDITATSDGRDVILHIIEAVASQVFIPLTVGGGVRTVDDVRRLLNAGADKTSFNSAAIANPQVIRDASAKYGAQCIVVAIDAKRRSAEDEQRIGANGVPMGPGWDVYSHGGRKNVGLDAVAWATQMAEHGAGEILLTSMDRDGTKSGFDLALTRAVSDAVPVPVEVGDGVGVAAAEVEGDPEEVPELDGVTPGGRLLVGDTGLTEAVADAVGVPVPVSEGVALPRINLEPERLARSRATSRAW